jgi:hypothetical protein
MVHRDQTAGLGKEKSGSYFSEVLQRADALLF